jgi:hypothetical protein
VKYPGWREAKTGAIDRVGILLAIHRLEKVAAAIIDFRLAGHRHASLLQSRQRQRNKKGVAFVRLNPPATSASNLFSRSISPALPNPSDLTLRRVSPNGLKNHTQKRAGAFDAKNETAAAGR